ncbi:MULTISPECIES: GlxA family transcriptional regulator [Serratia]|uniref:GlxA family transcriptional regulator n=1 Tax=Serratia TaxID=613 RepID=UPI000744F966|nr:helix-turn-helix domain-containing protein [Serratia marcescens]ELY3099883.1 helix-turn-helix domain-containing protein [Serratia marcescens]MBE8814836.1 helix-turn-helix domain-containing protein [Serratia marcescens]MBH2914741.1 helix-turn-helix domain-containing protein [Serratia marcescens]MBH3035222.1 helix-turn-helix domain-containing protein [Serratia marcescens]MBH3065113.1 helix-turn-helix domain-containing protein [Serratia marcescens]
MKNAYEKNIEPKPDLTMGFLLMKQFTLASVAGLVESLRFAADESFSSRQIFCQWEWMTCDDRPVTASCGLPVSPTAKLDFSRDWDYFVVAGGLLEETRTPPEWLLQALRDLHARNIPIITLCSGAFVAGNAGLLDNHHCAIHFTTRDEFRLRFPKAIPVIDKTYIKDGGIISCPGGMAIDLAADLIRQHCGLVRSQKVLKYLLMDAPQPAGKTKQKAPLNAPDVYENERVSKVIEFMKQHLDSPIPLADVADFAGVTFRQLNLIFTKCTGHSAAVYWRSMRLEQARKLMTDSSNSINEIATATGFSDASHLISWFRKQYGETPSSFRKRRREVEKLVKE